MSDADFYVLLFFSSTLGALALNLKLNPKDISYSVVWFLVGMLIMGQIMPQDLTGCRLCDDAIFGEHR